MRRAHRVVISTFALAGLAAAAVPLTAANAATVLSRSDASAVTVDVAGQGAQGTGPVTATFDGSQENVSGNTTPSFPQPAQNFLTAGVLTQRATAGNGFSRACAGIAGNGDGIVTVGQGSCINPNGAEAEISLASLNLESLTPTAPDAGSLPQLAELIDRLPGGAAQLNGILGPAVAALDNRIGPLGLSLRTSAVEARCAVENGSPSGSATVANPTLAVTRAGQTLQVVDLPITPSGATNEVGLLRLVLDALQVQLTNGLGGAAGPLADLTQEGRDAVIDDVLANLEGQLAPIRDNLIRVTANVQDVRADSIRVDALSIEVLPAAAQFVGASLVNLAIGSVGCGPAARVAGVESSAPAPEAAPAPAPARIPTAVSAGVGSESDSGPGAAAYLVLAVGVGAVGATGVAAARRRSARG